MDIMHFKRDEFLLEVMRNFFLQVPFKCFHEELKDYTLRNFEIVFPCTFSHEINIKYPLKKSYQVSFLKNLISELEARNEDVDEKVYLYYLKLIKEPEDETHHIHYMLSADRFISIQQNTSTISDGTTGLSVWQAGKVLADYCVENVNLFEKQKVLELGCGVGLTGLAIVIRCEPSQYWFTDIHDKVLNYLANNVKLNLSITHCHTEEQNSYFESADVKTKISIVNLPWEKVDSDMTASINPDVILAADVVYDPTLFHPFCQTIKEFLNRNINVKILIACTVRDITTLEEFFSVLHEYHLLENEIKVVMTWNSSFMDKCLVKIFSLCPTNESS